MRKKRSLLKLEQLWGGIGRHKDEENVLTYGPRLFENGAEPPKVLVLLSTYNGEKYLQEQLESVNNQSGVSLECLIRDDGSIDNSYGIIKDFCTKHSNFHCYAGTNVGVVKSFGLLIKQAISYAYDWIAFCDQDDVWDNRKIISGLELLINQPTNIPLLYCSDLKVTDSNLNYMRMMRGTQIYPNEYQACVQNCSTGCTQIFNRQAAILYANNANYHIEMHDYWMYLICLFLGKVIYDQRSFIMYRQHSNNVVGARKRTYTRFFHNISLGRKTSKRILMLRDFTNAFYTSLSQHQVGILENVIKSEHSILSRISIFFSPLYVGFDHKVTVGFKFKILIGRMN